MRGLAAGLVRKLYHSSVRCQRRSDAGGGRVRGVLDLDGRGRGARRVVVEVGADEVAVPGPVVLGVGRRVDAGVAAAGLDVALERGLLGRVEHVTGGGEEDDDLVLREVGVVERAAVLGGRHREVVVGGERLDGGGRLVDVGVAERSRLGEEERVERLLRGCGGGCLRVGGPRDRVAQGARGLGLAGLLGPLGGLLRLDVSGGGGLGARCRGGRGGQPDGRAQRQRHDQGHGGADRDA